MSNLFDQLLERGNEHFWLKEIFTPEGNRRAGRLSYAGAEFEFPTCPALCENVARTAAKGLFGYNLPNGKYAEHVQWWMRTVRGFEMNPDWLLTTHGTIFSLATAIRMQTKPGERIITLTPGYHRYEQAADRLGRGTVKVPEGDWAAIEAAMADPANRLLVLCNPNNPTGKVTRREDLLRLAELSRKYQVLVFSDEIFADVVFGEECVPCYAEVAGEDALAISCTSLGKAFSLTGVNHANVIIRNAALREDYRAQRDADHYGSLDPLHASAVIGAYSPAGQQWLQEMKGYVLENMRLVKAFFEENLPGVQVGLPEGTFVMWIDFAPTGMNAAQVQEQIVEKGLFAGDPGEEYNGPESCMRFSMAAPRDEIIRSLQHLKEALQR